MSDRLATRIGLLPEGERAPGSLDVIRFREPKVGAEARTKGSLFVLAQVTGGDAALARGAREAVEALERDYYYDLTAGAVGALAKALSGANRRIFHQRQRLGIGRRAGLGIVALVVHGREAVVARLGPAGAVIVREDRIFELPPPAPYDEEDPRVQQRRVASTLGEALEIEPFTWQGDLTPGDRLALVSRNLAEVVGSEELRRALVGLRPTSAAEHLHHLFLVRGGEGSDGLLALEVSELPATAHSHPLQPVRPAEPLAGLPDRSPVPLADDIGGGFRRAASALDRLQAGAARGVLIALNTIFAFIPRRGPDYPRSIPRTALVEEARRRRLGLMGMLVVASLVAAGASVASLPSPRPTEAIPRAAVAAAAIASAQELMAEVRQRVGGLDLIDRDPDRARALLGDADDALLTAIGAGVSPSSLGLLRREVDRGLDELYGVARIGEAVTIVDLATGFEEIAPLEMVATTDGALWVIETARGRVIRVDPATGEALVVYRAGQSVNGLTTGEPWLIASAATDVVVIDRSRQAWRFDLGERLPYRLGLPGIAEASGNSRIFRALQHRPPLEIFTLYLLDVGSREILKWTPGDVVPVIYPSSPEPFLTERPDRPLRDARDILVDANLWLLHADTLTRVNFGTPVPQEDYSLDPPPDADLRTELDYRLIDGATVGERELFYVWDAANARIVAFQRADGAFVRQWLAPSQGPLAGVLDEVLSLSVASVADGPPAAFLLTPDRVLRVVLE